jgi:hypothetical protein
MATSIFQKYKPKAKQIHPTTAIEKPLRLARKAEKICARN